MSLELGFLSSEEERKCSSSNDISLSKNRNILLVDKNNRKYLKDVKPIPWELQHHRLVVTDMDQES